jgi:cytochrome c biogenesis protein CcmG, thiol:disulfide interchange protein DsbE
MKNDSGAALPQPDPERPFTRRVLRAWLLVVGLSLVALIAGVVVLAVVSPGGEPKSIGPVDFAARGVRDDDAAPEFSLPEVGSTRTIRLSEFRGRVVVLNLWASWCGPCEREAPVLQTLWRRYARRGVQFIGIDHRDNSASAQRFQSRHGITFPSAFDPKGSVAVRYGAVGVPTTYVIVRGRIVYHFVGAVRGPELAKVLDGLLMEEVETP